MIKLIELLTENLDSEIDMLKKYMKAGGERTIKIDSTIRDFNLIISYLGGLESQGPQCLFLIINFPICSQLYL